MRQVNEVTARAINAEPWEPLPGMVKRRCEDCGYWFAVRPERSAACCPDCQAGAGKGRQWRYLDESGPT